MDPTLPLLMELGDACGLQPTYTDYWGHKRTLAEPALRHFLSAMGCDGGDEAALRAALAQHRQSREAQSLSPVCVRRRRGTPVGDARFGPRCPGPGIGRSASDGARSGIGQTTRDVRGTRCYVERRTSLRNYAAGRRFYPLAGNALTRGGVS